MLWKKKKRIKRIKRNDKLMSIDHAIEVLKIEAEGILNLIDRIDENFDEMVRLICDSKGRLILAGIGKSGIVARKIVATLNSTGTRSFFLHPVEAMHGDLGQVSFDDIFLALSNSGETDELNILTSNIRNIGCKIIAFTGNIYSTLAKNSDIVIDVGVKREACPLGLAPTASTTAQLAMGDSLAVVLINKKKFKSSDFQRFHPGGKLGVHLSNQVKDIMLTGSEIPYIEKGMPIKEAVEIIDKYKLGHAIILKLDNTLWGIISDGDLRRMLVKKLSVETSIVDDIMTKNPKVVNPDSLAYDALNLMEQFQITALPVVNSSNRVLGLIHLHDILGKGSFKFNGS